MAVVHVASFDELDPRTAYLLWQLRESVFVVEQACAYQELDGRDLEPRTAHLWVERGGRPVAYLRILSDETQDEAAAGKGVVRIGRVVVAASARGEGLAGTLMRRALEEIGGRDSELDAQSYLADWYTGFGFTVVGEEFLEDGIPHVPMRRRPTPK